MTTMPELLRGRDRTRAEGDGPRHRVAAVRVLLGVLVVSALVYSLVWAGFTDLHVYRAGADAWLSGVGLYSDEFVNLVPGTPLPFLYPPLSAILFVPVYLLGWHAAKVVVVAGSLAALCVTTLLVARRIHGRTGFAVLAGLAVAALWVLFEPVRKTIGFGQINLILMGLVAADCLLPRTRWPRGLLLGLAIAIKLTPAVFVLFFLIKRQYRHAATAVGSFLGFSVLGFALAPGDSVRYWFGVLLDPDKGVGVAYAYNQSFNAILHRIMPGGAGQFALWMALVLLTFVIAVVAAARAHAVGNDVTALLAIAIWGLLASPLSWSHHWVWIVPATLVLLRGRPARDWTHWVLAVVVLGVFAVGPHALLPSTHMAETHWTWWQHLLGSSYVLIGLGVLITLAIRPRDV